MEPLEVAFIDELYQNQKIEIYSSMVNFVHNCNNVRANILYLNKKI